MKFVSENSKVIFEGTEEERTRIRNVITVTFPQNITDALFRKLEQTATTERHRDGYWIAASENPKLARLFEKYGITSGPGDSVNFVNSVNSL